jgi:Fic family protein
MRYNWQQKDWGKFTFSIEKLEPLLYAFIESSGHLNGLLQGLPRNFRHEAIVEVMVAEAMKTSEIEAEFLSRNDVTSSIRKNLGLLEPQEEVKDLRAKGMGKLMVAVRDTYDQKLTEDILQEWHSYLFLQKTNINVGVWRSGEEPMQVVSGPMHDPIVHFEAPPSSQVPNEMKRFIAWFNDTAPGGKSPMKHAPIRSAIAHLYFESIHPFEDGNGRIGRAIADKALSQSVGFPLLLSLSATIENGKAEYYRSLEEGQRSNEITPWLSYFIQVILDSQKDAESIILFTLRKARFFDKFSSDINSRQLKVINRMFQEGPKGFEGGMTAKKYMRLTGASKATATRDLQGLERMRAFVVFGQGRSTSYELNMAFD